MVLEVKGLRFAYRGELKFVLDGIEMKLNDGEILVLLGPNGCGKTTLLKCINRLLKPIEGAVLVEDRNLIEMNERDIAKTIAYVPQHQKLPFPYKVLEFVLLGRAPHIGLFSAPRARDYEIAIEALKLLGIENLADRFYTELSGGERQLVLIARALASEAKILLLDEPTAHLDFKNTHRVLGTLRKIIKERGLSAIITLHDPNLAQRYGDKVAVVQNGRIFKYGLPKEIIDSELIKIVYGIEAFVLNFDNLRVVVPK